MSAERLQTVDGNSFDLLLAAADNPNSPLLLICPAMGVRASFYRGFMEACRNTGLNAAVLELRGHGSHSLRASRQVDYGYQHILEQEFPAAIQFLRRKLPNAPLYLFGHSFGGHLSALYAGRHGTEMDGIILCAAGTNLPSNLPNPHSARFGIRMASVVSSLLGYFPGDKLNFGGRDGRSLMQQWATLGRSGSFQLPAPWDQIEGDMARYTGPLLSICIAGDSFAPRPAADHLADKLPNAKLTRLDLERPPGKGNPHFTWAKTGASQPILEQVQNWLAKQ